MLFKPRHVPLIRDGIKTATRRDWAENYPRPEPGHIRMVQYDRDDLDKSPMFISDEECDCYIRITDVYDQHLEMMTAEDADKGGGYELADFRAAWEEINGEWDKNQVVTVVEFEYVGRERPTRDPGQEELPA